MFRSFCCAALCLLLLVCLCASDMPGQAQPVFFGLFFPELTETERGLFEVWREIMPKKAERLPGEAVGV